MRKLFAVLAATALVLAFGVSSAFAAPGGQGKANPPACQKGKPKHNPHCQAQPATCPPASGPISGVVQQISDAIRDGGGAPLADVIDEINCQLIVGVLGLSGPDVGA